MRPFRALGLFILVPLLLTAPWLSMLLFVDSQPTVAMARWSPEHLDELVVRIFMDDPGLFESSSGSVVPIARHENQTIYLTCMHCVSDDADSDLYEVLEVGTRKMRAPVSRVERHPTLDLALVWAPFVVPGICRLSFDPVEFGDPLVVAGWVTGDHLIVQRALAGRGSRMAAFLYGGMSGGPVLDEAGRLVGVNEASWMVQQEQGVYETTISGKFVPLAEAEEWLLEMVPVLR